MGLQIDGNRFFGYMPVSAIVRLCRNIAKVEVKRTAAIILPGVHQEQQREASQPEPVWQSEELQLILMEKNGE